MEDIIWKRLKIIESSDLNFIHYYNLEINISYQEIEALYKQYIYKYYFGNNDNKSIFKNDDVDKVSLKLSLFEPMLANVLEDLFECNLKNLNDELILIYLKDEDSALILFKSYFPLSDMEGINLPHFCYYLKNTETIKQLNNMFKKNEHLCLMSCSSNSLI